MAEHTSLKPMAFFVNHCSCVGCTNICNQLVPRSFLDWIRFGVAVDLTKSSKRLKYNKVWPIAEDTAIFLLASKLVQVSVLLVAVISIVESRKLCKEWTRISRERV